MRYPPDINEDINASKTNLVRKNFGSSWDDRRRRSWEEPKPVHLVLPQSWTLPNREHIMQAGVIPTASQATFFFYHSSFAL